MAFDRLDVGLLFEGAGAQQFAVLAAGQNLLAQLLVFLPAARIQGGECGLHIHLGDALPLLPEGTQEFHEARGPL